MKTLDEKVYYLGGHLSPRFRSYLPVARLRGRKSIAQAVAEAVRKSGLWIIADLESLDELLREAFRPTLYPVWHRVQRRSRLGRLLLLEPPRLESIQPLEELFSPVAWGTSSFKTLPFDELTDVLAAENRHDLFAGGYFDPRTEILTLYRGDFEKLSVPLATFQPSGTGVGPDPSAFQVTDHGQTIRLGDYEAATDAILYEGDADYRCRLNAERREEDKTFGACLRRLRKQRGLRQSDFDPIPAKTIARIERGETEKPRGQTLDRIAKLLGVEPDEITSY